MRATEKKQHIEPAIGAGIYLIKDVSQILHLPYEKVYRWILGYWEDGLDNKYDYVFGDSNNRAINFYSLIEFYTFFKLRERGVSTLDIRKLHQELSKTLDTPYPFAVAHDYYVDKKHKRKVFIYYKYLESLIRLDRKKQFSFDFIINDFLDKIEFDDSNFARRYFPIGKDKNVVVDPQRQFGQPTVIGRSIKTQTINSLYIGGESKEDICILYNLTLKDVEDAIQFHNAAA